MAKQFWRIGQQPHSLLIRTMKGKYYPKERNLWEVENIPKNSTRIWRTSGKQKISLLAQAKWQVGRGDSIRLRDSLWLKQKKIYRNSRESPSSARDNQGFN